MTTNSNWYNTDNPNLITGNKGVTVNIRTSEDEENKRFFETLEDVKSDLKSYVDQLNTSVIIERDNYKKALQDIDKIVTEYSKHEDYLLSGLFADLINELNEVLKDDKIQYYKIRKTIR